MKMKLDVRPTKHNVYRYLGINFNKGVPLDIERMIDKAIKETNSMINIKYYYRYTNDHTIVKNIGLDLKFFGKLNLKGYFLFIITIGNKVEDYSSLLMNNGNYTMATIIDSIGTDLVESGAQKLENYIKNKYKEKGYFTGRISPGYGDWDISYQRQIFNFLEVDFIELTSSLMMKPQKSITAALALMETENNTIIQHGSSCDYCNLVDCNFRGEKNV